MVVVVGVVLVLAILAGIGAAYLHSNSSSSSLHVRFPAQFSVEQKALSLPNGLEVVLISDPNSSKSSASMSIGTGQFGDGEIAGLAHFVEHLLFIGSGKYPEEGYFMGQVNENGGSTNAYTASEETVFFFDVKASAFERVLDVFSGFFTSPLFPANRVQDEIKAVNSEHEMYLFNDSWRLQRLLGVLADPGHPISGFHVGSTETLANVTNLHEKAREFREKHYVAGNMRLVLYGNHTLTHMTDWASRMFREVPKGHAPAEVPHVLYNKTGQFAVTNSITPGNAFYLMWPLTSQYEDLEAQPVNFLAFLLNNRGKGGLRQSLMTEGLVLDVEAGILESLTDSCLLYIELRFSESGFEHWETAIELVLAYIRGLRSAETSDLEQAWDHYKASRLADFDYIKDFSAMNIAVSIASNMLVFPQEQYLAGFDLQENVDLASFRGELEAMTLENCVGVFMSSMWNKGDLFLGKKLKFSESEHFYGISYDLFAFPNSLKGDFELNPFLPAVLPSSQAPITLQPCPNCSSLPTLLLSSKSLQIWHSFDASYNKPFTYVSVFMSCPASVVGQVLTRMYISQLQYLYEEKSALWDTGVRVEVERTEGTRTGRGLTITISSPNALLANATKAALAVVPPSSNSYFSLIYEDLRTELDKKGSERPIQRANAVLKRLTVAGAYLDSELLAALEDITLGEIEDFYWEVAHSGNTVSLISGNIDSETAAEIATIMEDWSSNRHPDADSFLTYYEIHGSYAYQEVLVPSSLHAIINWYNLGASSNSTLAAAIVLAKFVKYGAFDELRNKQQLGYVAGAELYSVLGNVQMIVVIQGAYQPPHVMDLRIGEFLRDFEGKLENLTDTDISNAKDSAIKGLLVGSETMKEWHSKTFSAILYGEDVGLNLYLIPYIQQVTKAELKHLIASARTSHSDISVQVYKEGSKPSHTVNRTQVSGLDYFA